MYLCLCLFAGHLQQFRVGIAIILSGIHDMIEVRVIKFCTVLCVYVYNNTFEQVYFWAK